MARGDPEWCKMETDFILNDARLVLLPLATQLVYLKLWAKAVQERREILRVSRGLTTYSPGTTEYSRSTTEYSRVLRIKADVFSAACQKLSAPECGLLEIIPPCYIKVCGVRSKHPALAWKEEYVISPNGECLGQASDPFRPQTPSERRVEESTVPPVSPKGEGGGNASVDIADTDPVPYKQIVEFYNKSVGTVTPDDRARVSDLTLSRREKLATRWRERGFHDRWQEIFTRAAASDFLCGRKLSPGHERFRGDFDWLVKNDFNYAKVLEGKKYRNDGEQTAVSAPKKLSDYTDDELRAAKALYDDWQAAGNTRVSFRWNDLRKYDLEAEWKRRGIE